MAILAKNLDDNQYEFTCSQWALMSDDSKADWTVLENTCGIQTMMGNPYAASEFILTLQGKIQITAPLTLSIVDGVYTIGVILPTWYVYTGVVSSNRIIVPTGDFVLPANEACIYAIIRKAKYLPGEDLTVNYIDNSLDFEAGLNLNGQRVSVFAYL